MCNLCTDAVDWFVILWYVQDDVHRCSGNLDVVLQLAYQRGHISAEERQRVFGVMRQLGLAIWHEVCTTEVLMQVGSCPF